MPKPKFYQFISKRKKFKPKPKARVKESRSRDLDFIMGSRFTERTGLTDKWVTDRDWTILMNNKRLKKYPMCRDCMNKSSFKFTIWWWAKSECSCCGVLGSDLYKEGKGLVIASIRNK
jgi:hypothetical protein